MNSKVNFCFFVLFTTLVVVGLCEVTVKPRQQNRADKLDAVVVVVQEQESETEDSQSEYKAEPKPEPDPKSNYLDKMSYFKENFVWQAKECEVTVYTLDECDKPPRHPKYGITAHGKRVLEGRTVAASPEIPEGTLVQIPGLKNIFKVEDRGGAIKTHCGRWPGNIKIDVYTRNKAWALNWGRKKLKCKFLFAPEAGEALATARL